MLLEGVVLDLGEFGLGLGREGLVRLITDLALRREGASHDGLHLAVGGALE